MSSRSRHSERAQITPAHKAVVPAVDKLMPGMHGLERIQNGTAINARKLELLTEQAQHLGDLPVMIRRGGAGSAAPSAVLRLPYAVPFRAVLAGCADIAYLLSSPPPAFLPTLVTASPSTGIRTTVRSRAGASVGLHASAADARDRIGLPHPRG